MYVVPFEPVLIAVAIGVAPEGSGALLLGPKNHSKVGEGTLEGRGMGSTRTAEHISEEASPAIPEREGEIVTGATE